jgi:hypothetical protein
MPGYAVVVGAATGKTSPEEARQAAQAAAVSRLTARFGFTSQLTYRETNSQQGGVEGRKVEERLETVGPRVRLDAPEVVAWHDEDQGNGRWGAYVLVRYPLVLIKREKDRLSGEDDARKVAAAAALSRARHALNEGLIGEALPLLGEARGAGAELIVREQAEAELRRVAAGLSLETLPAAEFAATPAGFREPLKVRASLGGRPAAGLVVRFRFTTGRGEADDAARTDAFGVALCRVGALDPGPVYVLRAEALLPNLGAPLPSPQTEFRFSLRALPWRVAVEVAEENLGQPQARSVVAAAVTGQLMAAGLTVVSAKEGAEVVISGQAATRAGSDNMGWDNAAVADVRLQASLKGRVLADKAVHLADFSDSVEQAGLNALKRAGEAAARAMLEGLYAAAP